MKICNYVPALALSIVAACAPVDVDDGTTGEGEGEGDGEADGANANANGDEGEGEGNESGDEGENEGDEGENEGGACEPEVITAPTGPACSAVTKACLDACTDDDDCYDNCLAADARADECAECLDGAFIACANAAGCQAQSDALSCCAESCPDPEADSCYSLTCGPESSAFDTCLGENATGCDDADVICFAQ